MEQPEKRPDDGDEERQLAWAAGLKARFDAVAQAPLPDEFLHLLERIEEAECRTR